MRTITALLFLAGCGRCPDPGDIQIVNKDAADVQTDRVQDGIDQFVAWFADPKTCVTTITVVSGVIASDNGDAYGQYDPNKDDMLVSDQAGSLIATVVRHELCHAIDYQAGAPEHGLSEAYIDEAPPADPVFDRHPLPPAPLYAGEVFAALCQQPPVDPWIQQLGQDCRHDDAASAERLEIQAALHKPGLVPELMVSNWTPSETWQSMKLPDGCDFAVPFSFGDDLGARLGCGDETRIGVIEGDTFRSLLQFGPDDRHSIEVTGPSVLIQMPDNTYSSLAKDGTLRPVQTGIRSCYMPVSHPDGVVCKNLQGDYTWRSPTTFEPLDLPPFDFGSGGSLSGGPLFMHWTDNTVRVGQPGGELRKLVLADVGRSYIYSIDDHTLTTQVWNSDGPSTAWTKLDVDSWTREVPASACDRLGTADAAAVQLVDGAVRYRVVDGSLLWARM